MDRHSRVYKAGLAGVPLVQVPLVQVDPRNSSRELFGLR
jgi:hypothetical protein